MRTLSRTRLHRLASRRGIRFWLMAFDSGLPPVHWIVRVNPKGETSLRCALQRVRRAAAARHATEQVSLQARQPGREEQREG